VDLDVDCGTWGAAERQQRYEDERVHLAAPLRWNHPAVPEHDDEEDDDFIPPPPPLHVHAPCDGHRCCCKTHTIEPIVETTSDRSFLNLESLSYMPFRFDEAPASEAEKSLARYTPIVVRNTRIRSSQGGRDWVMSAKAGRSITLLSTTGSRPQESPFSSFARVGARYSLDRGLSTFCITPSSASGLPPTQITMDKLRVICPARGFALISTQVERCLDEAEKNRAVMLEYLTEELRLERLCFLEESETARDRLVQSLTALWLEKRNSHSMWF